MNELLLHWTNRLLNPTFALMDDLSALKKREQPSQQKFNRAYFSGLDGLSTKDRATWEKAYAKEIQGMNEREKNNYFRNTIFLNIFGNSTNKEDQEIFNKRKSLTKRERDKYVAQKALKSDIDGISNIQESPTSGMAFVLNPFYKYDVLDTKLFGNETVRQQAYSYLEKTANEKIDYYDNLINNLDSKTVDRYLKDLDTTSSEISPYYKMYLNHPKLF